MIHHGQGLWPRALDMSPTIEKAAQVSAGMAVSAIRTINPSIFDPTAPAE